MSDAPRRASGSSPSTSTQPAGLRRLLEYPLLSALRERRTRRVSRGTSVRAGELSHTSTNAPQPLSPLEEAVLIVATGLTGVILHDGPLFVPNGGKELGTPMLRVLGRTASSPDNAQGTSFFMINDEGIWLIRKPSGQEAAGWIRDLPPRWEDWSEQDWIAAAGSVKHRLHEQRLEFPRRFPYYHVWNKQLSNVPGTTLFLPVVDCTRGMMNIILNLLSEPDGERGLIVDDWQPFRPKGGKEIAAWLASRLGLIDRKIHYQPVGGIAWARDGFLNPDIVLPLGLARTWRVDYEALLLLQNLMLVGQGAGLGAWIHASIFPPYIFERDPAKGHLGLGFRMERPRTKPGASWPPLPAIMPNPVGIDGVLEALTPPYVKSMDQAVDRFLEEKYGAQGAYGDRAIFDRPYRTAGDAASFLATAQPYSKKAIRYLRDVCGYIFDTYGRFPAHVDAFHVPGVWVQFSHLEMEYYRKFYQPGLFVQQEHHADAWGH
jgi:hypothetical protein